MFAIPERLHMDMPLHHQQRPMVTMPMVTIQRLQTQRDMRRHLVAVAV